MFVSILLSLWLRRRQRRLVSTTTTTATVMAITTTPTTTTTTAPADGDNDDGSDSSSSSCCCCCCCYYYYYYSSSCFCYFRSTATSLSNAPLLLPSWIAARSARCKLFFLHRLELVHRSCALFGPGICLRRFSRLPPMLREESCVSSIPCDHES